MITNKQFITTVYDFYQTHGRHTLPWRHTKDAYAILVSEVMLQQTQVERVIPKYEVFMTRFPDACTLAAAPLAEVLLLWQGLGYNRRAKMLHSCAKVICTEYQGALPADEVRLRALPGIGVYTARAIMAFAYNTAIPLIETNVRTVYIHHFFPKTEQVTDALLMPIITETLDTTDPRSWYYALMDYGSYLKRSVGNVARKSSGYVRQSTFAGSDRQIRGAIIRALVQHQKLTSKTLFKTLSDYDGLRIHTQTQKLCAEGLVVKHRQHYTLPT